MHLHIALFIVNMAAAPAEFHAVRLPLSDSSCYAAALNDLGEVGLNCNQRLLVVDQEQKETELATRNWCGYLRFRALNNARQAIAGIMSSFSCITGGTSRYLRFLPDGLDGARILGDSDSAVLGLNNAGRAIASDFIWEDAIRPFVHSGVRATAWNDFEQTFAINESFRLSYRLDTRTGTPTYTRVPLFGDSAVLNARGWVAVTALPEYGNSSRNPSTGELVIDTFDDSGQLPRVLVIAPGVPGVYYRPLRINNRGWVLFQSTTGASTQYQLWDGDTVRTIAGLLPAELRERNVLQVVGPNEDGVLAVTLEPRPASYSDYETYRLTPTGIEPFREILKPESGPELTGHGEYLGCDAQTGDAVLTGWVFDASRPKMPPAVELYDGTRLVGASIAVPTLREDGTFGYQVVAPANLFRDGGEHFLNVRFAGTATAIEQAWGTISCAAAATH
jgi:hypothetical protein